MSHVGKLFYRFCCDERRHTYIVREGFHEWKAKPKFHEGRVLVQRDGSVSTLGLLLVRGNMLRSIAFVVVMCFFHHCVREVGGTKRAARDWWRICHPVVVTVQADCS